MQFKAKVALFAVVCFLSLFAMPVYASPLPVPPQTPLQSPSPIATFSTSVPESSPSVFLSSPAPQSPSEIVSTVEATPQVMYPPDSGGGSKIFIILGVVVFVLAGIAVALWVLLRKDTSWNKHLAPSMWTVREFCDKTSIDLCNREYDYSMVYARWDFIKIKLDELVSMLDSQASSAPSKSEAEPVESVRFSLMKLKEVIDYDFALRSPTQKASPEDVFLSAERVDHARQILNLSLEDAGYPSKPS